MLALRDEAETYAPTLLEVAKLAFNRPLASLGLVGILESRSALRQRIERLVNFPRAAQGRTDLRVALRRLHFQRRCVADGESGCFGGQSACSQVDASDQNLTVKVNPEVFIKKCQGGGGHIHACADG